MDIDLIEKYLSKFLNLPDSVIFDKSGELTSLCLMEFANSIDMPSGFFLTEAIRIPKSGEYFLDAKALVERDRLVVYKAIGPLFSLGIILETEEEIASYSEEGYSEFGAGGTAFVDDWKEDSSNISFLPPESESDFNWALCEAHGGLAMHGKDVIEVLSNYVDPYGVISAIAQRSKKLILINISELKNLPEAPPSLPDSPFLDMFKELKDMPALPKPKKEQSHKNRMSIKFNNKRPPGLDDLLNELF